MQHINLILTSKRGHLEQHSKIKKNYLKKNLVFIWTLVFICLSQFKSCWLMLVIPRDSEQMKKKKRKKRKRDLPNYFFSSETSEA